MTACRIKVGESRGKKKDFGVGGSGSTAGLHNLEALGDDMASVSGMTSDMIYGFGEDRFSQTIMMMIPRFILRDDDQTV